MLSFTKNDCILIFQFHSRSITLGRAFHKLFEIFQKGSFSFSKKKNVEKSLKKKKQSKDAFYNKGCSKVAWKNKTFFALVLKCANFTTKAKISKHFCAIFWFNKRFWRTWSPIKTKKCNEPIKLFNDLLHPRYSSQISENQENFEFSIKTADLAARLLLSSAHDLPQGGVFNSFFTGNS